MSENTIATDLHNSMCNDAIRRKKLSPEAFAIIYGVSPDEYSPCDIHDHNSKEFQEQETSLMGRGRRIISPFFKRSTKLITQAGTQAWKYCTNHVQNGKNAAIESEINLGILFPSFGGESGLSSGVSSKYEIHRKKRAARKFELNKKWYDKALRQRNKQLLEQPGMPSQALDRITPYETSDIPLAPDILSDSDVVNIPKEEDQAENFAWAREPQNDEEISSLLNIQGGDDYGF